MAVPLSGCRAVKVAEGAKDVRPGGHLLELADANLPALKKVVNPDDKLTVLKAACNANEVNEFVTASTDKKLQMLEDQYRGRSAALIHNIAEVADQLREFNEQSKVPAKVICKAAEGYL
jgi:hypothetical protein